jgi:hypothetical protein
MKADVFRSAKPQTLAPLAPQVPGQLAAMSPAQGEAAESEKKQTYAVLMAGLRLRAAVAGTAADSGS